MDSEISEILSFSQKKPTTEKNNDSEIGEILSFVSPATEEPLVEHPQQDEDLSWGEAVIEGFQNIPSSGWQYAKDIASTIKHPVETLKSLNTLAGSFGQKLVPGKQSDEKYADAVIDFYKDRYGTTEGFKKSIAENPVGVLSDFASVMMMGGGALSKASKVSKLSKLSKPGEVITKLGAKMEPINITTGILKTPLRLLPESVPSNLYKKAVGFSSALDETSKNKVTRTALNNAVIPTVKGIEKIQNKINTLNEKITTLVTGKDWNIQKVEKIYSGLDDLATEMKLTTDMPKKVDVAIKAVKANLKASLDIGGTRTPLQIQKIKQGVYKDLKSLYDQHKTSPALSKVRKHVAKNAKELLEGIVPEIKGLNAQEGELIALYEAIQKRANTITNQDIFSFGLAMRMGTGAGVGSMVAGKAGATAGTALGVTSAIFHHPQVKSRLAILIHKIQQQGGTVKNLPTFIRLGLYETATQEETIKQVEETQ